jgi:hypothetical protein
MSESESAQTGNGLNDSGSNVAGEQGCRAPKESNVQKESNAPKESATDWTAIETQITSGAMTYPEAAEHFGIPENTIRKRASRKRWRTTQRTLKRLVTKQVQKQVEKTVASAAIAISASEIEAHKRKVFDITSKSIAKFRAKAPKTFRELDSADKIVRRAAGLQDDQTQVGVLLQVNESINAFDAEPAEDVPTVEGELVAEAAPA